jgi:hypothetical protein
MRDRVSSVPSLRGRLLTMLEGDRMAVGVTVDNFVRAETGRMFASLQAKAGGVNRFEHNRGPTPIDDQPVIRMNRDTLYSSAVVDVSEGATVTVPDGGDRYISVMVVNQDHFINRIFHEPGMHALTVEEFGTPWVGVAARILVDPADEDDVAIVNALQDQLAVEAISSRPFEMPDYDTASLDATGKALRELGRHMGAFDHAFGAESDVDPVRHLVATAVGWGGLPDREARYIGVEPALPVDEYKITVRDVPVDGFWSISVYNPEGFFQANDRNAYSVNNITAVPDDDGAVTVHFGACGDNRPNCLPIMDGWNYTVRLYRPRAEVLDGSWTFPAIEPV